MPKTTKSLGGALSATCIIGLGQVPLARAATPAAGSDASAGIDLEWDAPPECPTASVVRTRVEQLLGQPLETPRRRHIAARAKIRREESNQFELTLWLSANDHVSETTLVAEKCRSLADATALTIALASDPLVVAETVDSSLAAASTAKSVAAPPASSPSPQPAAPVTHLGVGVRVAGGAGFGSLPGVAPAVSLMSSLQYPGFRLEVGGHAFRTTDVNYAPVPSVGAHLQLFSGEVRGCLVPALAAITFPVCVGAELGWVRGEGFGLDPSQTSTSAWGAVVLGPAARVPLTGPWALWLEADAVIPALRPGFYARNLGTIYEAPTGGSRAWAGLEIALSP